MTDSGIKAAAKTLGDGVAKFGSAIFYEVAESPYQAAYQFADQTSALVGGKHLPTLEITKPDDSGWSTAGSFVGTIAKYALLAKVVHGAVSTGEARSIQQTVGMTIQNASVESTLVGGAAGFLTPVDSTKDYWKEKGIKTTIAAGSFGIMGGTAAAIGKSSFMSAERGSLARTMTINGLAGIAGGTAESGLDAGLHNKRLDLTQTAINAGTYGVFGAGFGASSHFLSARLPEASQVKAEESGVSQTEPKTTLREHAQRAIQTAQEHLSTFGTYLDNSIAKVNPLLMMDSGLQPAYARASYYPANSMRAYRAPNLGLSDNAMYSVAHQPRDFGQVRTAPALALEPSEASARSAQLKTDGPVQPKRAKPTLVAKASPEAVVAELAESKPKVATAEVAESKPKIVTNDSALKVTDSQTKPAGPTTYSIADVLGRSERGSLMSDVVATLMEDHPSFLKGLRSESPDAVGGGRDSTMYKLVDGKYKNALLRFTTIFSQPQGDTFTPTEWDSEWGKRPYDSPILSKVIEVENGADRVYVYVQENGEGAISSKSATFDEHEDASFARDQTDPSFQQMMRELEARGEEWVDPGSRQLVFSALKNRLVLVDYPAVMRSTDIPAEWRTGDNGAVGPRLENAYAKYNDENEAPEHDEEKDPRIHEVLDLSREEKRYDFLRREGSPQVIMQNEIAQQIFDGDSDKDMLPLVEFMYKDTLASLKLSAKEAIKSTRDLLKKQQLI